MLVLLRSKNEWVDIGNDISICVIDVQNGKVKLGITAPKAVVVNRREVTLAIEKEKEGTA